MTNIAGTDANTAVVVSAVVVVDTVVTGADAVVVVDVVGNVVVDAIAVDVVGAAGTAFAGTIADVVLRCVCVDVDTRLDWCSSQSLHSCSLSMTLPNNTNIK